MNNTLTPIFKWAGSKRKMLSKYAPLFEGLSFDTFVDLCGGTGITSVWIHKNFPNSNIVINEYNIDIYNIYHQIKNNFDFFIRGVERLESEYMELPSKELRKEYYLKLREKYHDNYHTTSIEELTYNLYFLMCTNFNGIWQAKAATGIYYTPFGNGGEKKGIYNRQAMSDFKSMIDTATIFNGSYEDVPIPENSLVFADPPYISSHTKYDSRNKFEDSMQLAMVKYLKVLGEDSLVGFCNKDHGMFREELEGWCFEEFKVKYTASRNDSESATAKEIFAHNFK